MKIYLPAQARDGNIAAHGKNGSGKTTTMKAILVEPVLAEGKLVCVVDPTSAWWGLRTSADGKGPGFKVLVLGGDHGDMPLTPNSGAAVARLLVEQRVSMVLDTGNFTVGERTRWMIEFAGTVYRLNRAPLYLVLDEAHVFAPQGKVPDPDTGKMLHAVNQIAAGGRSRGIRLTMISQRPQKLHKDALTTADTLIAMRVLAPQDREAIKAWIDGCGDPAQGKEVLDSLAKLQRGEGWVWYPEGNFLQRLQFPRIKTFDSSATPKEGENLPQPKGAAELDLSEIRAALADAVKDAEANDPKALKARIAQLERDAAKRMSNDIQPTVTRADLAAEYARGREDGFESGARKALEPLKGILPALQDVALHGRAVYDKLKNLMDKIEATPPSETAKSSQIIPKIFQTDTATLPASQKVQFANVRKPASSPAEGITSAQQRILDAAAFLQDTLGTQSPDVVQLALFAGQSATGGYWRANIGRLRSLGLMEGTSLTPTGSAAAQPSEITTVDQLHAHVFANLLTGAQRPILKALIEAYPDGLEATELARRCSMESSGGYWRANIGRLRSLCLITKRGPIAALPVLFLEKT